MKRKYTTSKGITKVSGSERRYIVVNSYSGTILYRTDDITRAYRAQIKYDGISKEVIDLETGQPATRPKLWR